MVEVEKTRVVLVEPLYGGNVGSVARVMKNFGLDDLVLVNPGDKVFKDPTLEPMARTAVDIINNSTIAPTLEEALSDVEIAMGFTTRFGRRRRDGFEMREALEKIAVESPAARTAAVFGREDSGLTTAELDLCHWLVHIPTGRDLMSLNLSQAVGLFAYEAFVTRRSKSGEGRKSRKVAPVAEMEGFYDHLEEVLMEIGFIEEATPERMMNEMRRIFGRKLPDSRDIRILRGMLSKVELKIERAKKGLE